MGNGSPVTGSAGAAPMSNWNSLSGSIFSSVPLTDSTGAGTTADLTVTGALAGEGSASSNQLLSGYVWAYGNSLSATISGIPYSKYRIYAYVVDYSSGYGEQVTIGGTTYYYSPNSSAVLTQITNTIPGTYPTGNFVMASGTASSQTITVQGVTTGNASLAGIEIVDTAIGSVNPLPITTPLSIAGGGTFDLGGNSQQVGSLSNQTPGSGGSIINSSTVSTSVLTISPTGGSTTFSGTIQGGGAVGGNQPGDERQRHRSALRQQ